MKSFYNVLFSVFFLFSVCYAVAQDINYSKKVINDMEYYEYPVQKGEGLYAVSRKFNVTQDEIKQANPGTEKGLSDGSVLLIPVKKQEIIIHKVEKKETLFSLTRKYNITYDELYELNPEVQKNGLKSGTEIKILKKKSSAQTMTVNDSLPQVKKKNGNSGFASHKVKKGETLYSISKNYNITIEEVVHLNPDARNGVKTGITLIIPQMTSDVIVAQAAILPDAPSTETTQNKSFAFHEVKKEETLYSISRKYGISQDEIIRLNPDAKEGVKAGEKLIIPPVHANTALSEEEKVKPVSRDFKFHEVQKEETLYSISRKYGVSQDEIIRLNPDAAEGVKIGKMLIIPPAHANTAFKPQEGDSVNTPLPLDTSAVRPDFESLFARSTEPLKTINIALALPFQLDKIKENSKIDGNTDKFLEFYRGLLIAVDSLKKQGLSFNLYVFDSGKSEVEIKNMLNNPELKNMDILIGPAYTVQIKPLSDFALLNQIKLIIPFSSKSEETKTNPNIFQINTPQPQMNELIALRFVSYFANKNIVLLRFKTEAYDDKIDFNNVLETTLKEHNITYTTVLYESAQKLRKELPDGKENIIVPLTTNQVALSQVLPIINMLGEKKNISLFGFPEWQTYQSISKDLFRLNTYIPSSFFVDYKSVNVKNYLRKYRYFYNAEPANIVPQYGLLGYDIATYFSEALAKYGHDFTKELEQFSPELLQMNFKFKQINENGGFYNSNVYITNHNDVTGLTKVNDELRTKEF
ncbi:MAG: LysM peptidoglycan-binding domain-containing protein [Prevotellaceae bacterium]|jgi:LysM repeat protein|nr:LysM peptidoglycan-binding domain-containing protein [Prevotellaceae bacterium]